MGSKQKNLIGLSFNYLQVQSLAPSRQFGKTKKRFWNCICKCGNETQAPTHALVSNKIKKNDEIFSFINDIKDVRKKIGFIKDKDKKEFVNEKIKEIEKIYALIKEQII